MHPVMTMKNWGHHLHDDMLRFEHSVSEHIHSPHFWVGACVALLIIAVMTFLMFWAMRVDPGTIDGFDYMYPYMYYRV